MKRQLREYIDEEGRRQITMADSEKPEDELCDFCSRNNPPFKVYQCKDFCHQDAPGLWSLGEWNACQKCAGMIDANDREGLAQHCALMLAFSDDNGNLMLDEMRSFQEEFFKNRIDIKQQSQSSPPEPKSGQPGSPGSHSSFHSQGGDFPDEDPSK